MNDEDLLIVNFNANANFLFPHSHAPIRAPRDKHMPADAFPRIAPGSEAPPATVAGGNKHTSLLTLMFSKQAEIV
jgi:hypothetical protein